jgi:putative transposase
MTPKYQNKYRIASARLASWDYGWDGAYFVTICTRDQVCIFGDVVCIETEEDAIMQLSEIGVIANDCWLEIPPHFPFARLGVHVVMPNHLHGIVIIDKPPCDTNPDDDVSRDRDRDGRDAINRVSTVSGSPTPTGGDAADIPRGGITKNKNPMLHDNLSRVIRWYKGRVTFESRKTHADFEWQSRFHDHIIRDGEEFDRISDYIINNPRKWKQDRFHPK